MTPAELIAEHTKLKDFVAAEGKRFAEWSKPHNERMQEIENALLGMLNEMNAGKPEGKRASLSTDSGTAYLSTIVTPKVTDKTQFLDWVLEDWDHRGAMLQIGAPQKDALQEWRDGNANTLPPFIETSAFTRVNIRRS